MRIISGKFKNKKLFFPNGNRTRPLKDNVKENIFNILEHAKNLNFEVINSNVVDFYAGTGSFGLECISRKASNVYFVEENSEALETLKKNIKNLGVEKQSQIFSCDVFKFMQNLPMRKKFDLIFLDPPYENKKYIEILKKVKKDDLLNENHIIILHREKNSDNDVSKNLKILENRIYGRSEIFFCRSF